MKAYIFDIDGTIADTDHRIHHLRQPQKDWMGFFSKQHLDPVLEPTVDVLNAINFRSDTGGEKRAVLIVTARAEEHRAVTEKWLLDNNIFYHKLYMRPQDDFRKGAIVKAAILEKILDDGFVPIMAFEDQPDIAEMWRDLGIMTAQVQPDEKPINTSKYQGQILLDILVGPVAAGKSTYIAEQIRTGKYNEDDVISSDALRDRFFGGHTDGKGNSPEENARLWSYIHGDIKNRLSHGFFTVLDATNVKAKDRKAVLACMPRGVMARYVVLDREYDEKLRTRGWRPESLVDKMHNTFKANLKMILRGDDHPYVAHVLDIRKHKI